MTFDARLRARAQRIQAGNRDWYRIKAAEGEAEVWIQDEISWLGVTARDFIRELRAVDAERLTLHINSPGGDVFDGIAIYDAIKRHPAKVTARITLAASIASVIAMAGDEVVMAEHGTMMIHEPFALTIGDAADHRKQAAILDQIGDETASIYAEKADNGTRHDQQIAKWRALMREETWYTAQAAVDAGLADRVDAADRSAPQNRFDLSVFRNAPSVRPPERPEPTPAPPVRPAYDTAALIELRDAMRALRGAA